MQSDERQLLMIPGPTMVPPPIMRESSRDMINHRSPEFTAIMIDTLYGLKWVFQTQKAKIALFTSSGTGGLESAIVNSFSPGEKIFVVSMGWFGRRVRDIATNFNLDVEYVETEWGEAPTAEMIVEKMKACNPKGVFLTHNETSSGVELDLEGIAKAIRHESKDILIFVDAVSSLAATELKFDEWDLDYVVSGTQKGLAVAPGIGIVCYSERIEAERKKSTMPKFYWDISKMETFASRGQTPFTPAIPQILGLQKSVEFLMGRGLDESILRHTTARNAVRKGVDAIGFKLLAPIDIASRTVTAVKVPKRVKIDELLWLMKYKYGIEIAGGFGPLKGKIIRFGHLGHVKSWDIIAMLSSFTSSLMEIGYDVEGNAVGAAQKTFLESAGLQ